MTQVDRWRAALSAVGLPNGADVRWLPPASAPGRVIVVHGPVAEVSWCPGDQGELRTDRFARRHDAAFTPVPGDWVAVRDGELVALGPRSAVLERPDPNGLQRQVLAANIDLALSVLPIDRGPNLKAAERLAVMVWDSGATPLVVLTKADGCADEAAVAAAVREVSAVVPGVEVIATSAVDGRGLAELHSRLGPGITATMVGQSGVGKTSLVNALEGRAEAVAPVRRDGEGRHTTTTRRLYPLASGGVMLDLPGLRLLDVLASTEAVEATFEDIVDLAADCRFRDCAHDREPGCAVTAAVADGTLEVRRLQNWRRLQKELAHLRRRDDPLARAAERARWTQISKASRQLPTIRGPR
ncbi:MAG: ribosome small subunit-dependent GTPase A [Austwickia sp.]|nr:ribosome small subunit-dependent GTPase A [Austwickia sp.]